MVPPTTKCSAARLIFPTMLLLLFSVPRTSSFQVAQHRCHSLHHKHHQPAIVRTNTLTTPAFSSRFTALHQHHDDSRHHSSPSSSSHSFSRLRNAILVKTQRTFQQRSLSLWRRPKWAKKMWRKMACVLASLVFCFSIQMNALAGPTGYRTGGSFKSSTRSSRPPIQRLQPSPYSNKKKTYYSSPSRPTQIYSNHFYRHGNWRRSRPLLYASPTRGVSVGDVALVVGTGGLIAYGYATSGEGRRHFRYNNDDDQLGGPLGAGASSTTLTVALNVPDRSTSNNILTRLKAISDRADTTRRQGIQELVSETALALLRNEQAITSCYIESDHYSKAERALRSFNVRSVENRSKFEKEAVNRFNGKDGGSGLENSGTTEFGSTATVAVATINLAIDGDSTYIPIVRRRADLIDALRRIAADSIVEDCLFSAEVLFTPAEAKETLTREDLYALYPKLLVV